MLTPRMTPSDAALPLLRATALYFLVLCDRVTENVALANHARRTHSNKAFPAVLAVDSLLFQEAIQAADTLTGEARGTGVCGVANPGGVCRAMFAHPCWAYGSATRGPLQTWHATDCRLRTVAVQCRCVARAR